MNIREQILPKGLNTCLCVVGTELVLCWSYRTGTADWQAPTLRQLMATISFNASQEDVEVLQAEINLLQIVNSDLELFASQDEALMLELENNNNNPRSARESEES
jgi:hypothetical protein